MTASANAKSKANSWLWQGLNAPAEQAGDRVPYEVLERTPRPDNPTAPTDPTEPKVDALTGLPLALTKAKSDLSTALAATSKSTPVTPERPEKPSASQNAQVPDPIKGSANPLLPAVAADQAKEKLSQESEPEAPLSVAFVAESATTTPKAPDNWESILESWHQLLQQWAQDGSLAAAAQEAFNLDGPNAKPQSRGLLQSIVAELAAGNFENLPGIVFLSNADMRGALGAYAISTGKIYLNADWANQATPEQIRAVLTEEQGHHLDGVLNEMDTPGDEGEHFSKRLLGEPSFKDYEGELRSQNDHGTILVKNNEIAVEKASTGWFSYVGATTDDITSRGIGYFPNGDIVTATSSLNLNGTRSLIVNRITKDGVSLWRKVFAADYLPSAGDVEVDSSGNIFISGTTRIGATGISGKNDFDVFALKIDGVGNQIWYRNYGTNINEWGNNVLEMDANGNIYINGRVSENDNSYSLIQDVSNWYGTGYTSGWSGFQLKIASSDGLLIKAYKTGSTNSGGELLEFDSTRNRTYAGGYTFGSVNGVATVGNGDANGANDYIVARNETTGSVLWTVIKSDIYSTIAADPASDAIYVINKGALEKINGSTGGLIWSKAVAGLGTYIQLIIGEDGGLYGTWNTSANTVTITRFSSLGAQEWSKSLTSTASIEVPALRVDPNGLLYVHSSTLGIVSVDGLTVSAGSKPGGIDSFVFPLNTPSTKANQNPTDLTLTSSGIIETSVAGTVIGTLAATDPDTASSFIYALAPGDGSNDADNNLVEIVGNQVKVKSGASIDFESNPTLNLYIQVTDNGTPGLTYTKAVTASVLNVNEAPTNLSLTSSGINENSAAGTVIGTLSASDPDSASSFTYALVTGDGSNDADNNLVEIVGNQVKVKSGASIDFESNPTLNLYIQVTDNGTPGLTYTKAVTASVLNVNEAPTNLSLTSSAFNENIAAGSIVATINSSDPDAGDAFTYALVAGTGSTDNAFFTINGNQLKINASPDFETKSTYSIRIRTTDASGLYFEKQLTMTVNDLIESVTYTGTGNSNLNGTAGDDRYIGTGTDNRFDGLGGYDRAARSGDLSNYTISGSTSSALIESITTVKSGKTTSTVVSLLDNLFNTESVQINGGNSNNTINAGGGTTNGITRSSFSGTFIAFGGAGVDTITGGTFKNWLAGQGLAAGVTSGVDTLTGTTNTTNGSMDVFDLRNTASTGAAYVGGGSADYARIANFNAGTDKLVLAGSATDYKFALTTVTGGRKTTTITDQYWAVSTIGGDLIAQVRGNITNFSQINEVIYGTGDPTSFSLGF